MSNPRKCDIDQNKAICRQLLTMVDSGAPDIKSMSSRRRKNVQYIHGKQNGGYSLL